MEEPEDEKLLGATALGWPHTLAGFSPGNSADSQATELRKVPLQLWQGEVTLDNQFSFLFPVTWGMIDVFKNCTYLIYTTWWV